MAIHARCISNSGNYICNIQINLRNSANTSNVGEILYLQFIVRNDLLESEKSQKASMNLI